MMSIKCFILMEFGTTQSEKEFAEDTYQYFLCSIAENLGYDIETEVDRADLSGKSGASLAENYLSKIATSELVIADLSGNSASVYYELGIRHALVPRETIIMAPRKNRDGTDFKVAFDVINDHHIYRYDSSHEIRVMKSEAARLSKEILDGRSKNSSIDSPIFHHVPDMKSYQERTQTNDQQILVLKAKIDQLQRDLERANKSTQNAHIDDRLPDIDFDAAYREQKLYGSEILKSLQSISRIESDSDRERREHEEADTARFLETLQTMNDSDFIDARTFRMLAFY